MRLILVRKCCTQLAHCSCQQPERSAANPSCCIAVSIEAESDRIDQLLKELEGKSIEEVIASGVSKLASVPSGGGGGGGGGGAAAGGGGGAAAAGGQHCVCTVAPCPE